MTTTPTDAQLAAWEALAAAASSGPWRADWGMAADMIRSLDGAIASTKGRENDVQFIAAAREGWPQCIAALRAARAELDTWAEHNGVMTHALNGWSKRYDELNAQLAAAAARTREIAGRAAVAMFRELRGDADSPDGHPDIWRPRIVRCVDAAMAPTASEPSAERAG